VLHSYELPLNRVVKRLGPDLLDPFCALAVNAIYESVECTPLAPEEAGREVGVDDLFGSGLTLGVTPIANSRAAGCHPVG
jgi:hypothetical protein